MYEFPDKASKASNTDSNEVRVQISGTLYPYSELLELAASFIIMKLWNERFRDKISPPVLDEENGRLEVVCSILEARDRFNLHELAQNTLAEVYKERARQ